MGKFVIFKNNENRTLVYYPVPKNANSSAKYFLVKHCGLTENFRTPVDRNSPLSNLEKKDQSEKKLKPAVTSFIPSKQKFSHVDADVKACILREPIDRFISAYTNRVLFRKDPGFYEHSIDMVIEKLLVGKFENKHFLPQVYFLGKDLNYFNLICCMDTLHIFEKGINSFFKNDIPFPWIQTKSSKLNLSKKQIYYLKDIYKEDEVLFNEYKHKLKKNKM